MDGWNMSNDNKSGKKRFIRQLIVFLVVLIIVAVIAVVVFFLVRKGKTQNVATPGNDSSDNGENISEDDEENNNDDDNGENGQEENREKERNSLERIQYSIEDKDFYFEDDNQDEESGIKLYEYDNTNGSYALIYYRLYSYTTDPSYTYIIEAKSEDGESLLLNERNSSISEKIMTGEVTSEIRLDKEKIGTQITLTVKKVNERSTNSRIVEQQTQQTLDLREDLVEKEEIDIKKNTAKFELEGFKFETFKEDKINKSTYTMYSPRCKTVAYSIGLSTQYGNRFVTDAHIQFSVLNNINDLTLEEAFEIERQIDEKIGHYGLADKYKIYVTNGSGEITSEFEFTFDEMKDLIAGKSVNVNGKKVAIQDITDGNDTMEYVNCTKVAVADKVLAIKYNYKHESDITRYMFMLDGYIYYLSVPNGEKYKENVDIFMNSLKQK